jgi:teichuronic acid biosynthesis glycosyltransferase TuaH
MLKNNLIIMPFHLPWNHSADYQQQTCLVLNKENLIICYMHHDAQFFLKKKLEKTYPKIKNIVFYQPQYLIPFRRFKTIEKLNQILALFFLSLCYGRGIKIILWIFDPMFYFYPKIRSLLPKIVSLYDCVDYHWSINPPETKLIRKNEKLLIKNVNFFFINSHILYKLHKSTRLPDKIVPQGFDLESFQTNKYNLNYPSIKNSKNQLIIGYIGSINYRLDYDLLIELIRTNPNWKFVFFGLIQTGKKRFEKRFTRKIETLFNLPNISYEGLVNKKLIPNIISQFDIGMIPYDMRYMINKYCYPMKLFEYFYMGKPVVSTPIEELKRFPDLVKIGKSAEEWEKLIQNLLSTSWPKLIQRKQKEIAITNSWENKIKAIFNFIEADQ